MHCLYGLQQAGYEFQLKGGTSLSKGHDLIYRFSEDIDIQISPPLELELKTGKNHNKPQHIQSRKSYYDNLAKTIKIEDIQAKRSTFFDDKSKYRSGGIRLIYESHFDAKKSAAKEGVLLEVGFDDVTPNIPFTISSWAYDLAESTGLDMIDNRAKNVPCYEAGYSFVEKLQAIATKYRNYKDGGVLPANFIRHYYDLYCLLQDRDVLAFSKTDAFETHRKKRFPKADYAIPLSQNEAFLLSDPVDFDRFKREYMDKKTLYYQSQPDFDAIINTIRQWIIER